MGLSHQLHPSAAIGTVHLKVKSLQTSLPFYTEVIGFQVLRHEGAIAELTTDGTHVLLILEESAQFHSLMSRNVSGLYHFAILVPDRKSLGLSLRNLAKHNIPIGQGDHLVSEALYLSDPDGNGIEIYADRPRETWQRDEQGEYIMTTDPVDIDGLLTVSADAHWQGLPPATVIGHVHFHVGDLRIAKQFYTDTLGFDVVAHYGGEALFISAGGYHHHIGLNTWAGKGAPAAPKNAVGLRYFTITLPNTNELDDVVSRISEAGIPFERQNHMVSFEDPFGIGIKLVVNDIN
jgi:catechol 2,3-dioxygenase